MKTDQRPDPWARPLLAILVLTALVVGSLSGWAVWQQWSEFGTWSPNSSMPGFEEGALAFSDEMPYEVFDVNADGRNDFVVFSSDGSPSQIFELRQMTVSELLLATVPTVGVVVAALLAAFVSLRRDKILVKMGERFTSLEVEVSELKEEADETVTVSRSREDYLNERLTGIEREVRAITGRIRTVDEQKEVGRRRNAEPVVAQIAPVSDVSPLRP